MCIFQRPLSIMFPRCSNSSHFEVFCFHSLNETTGVVLSLVLIFFTCVYFSRKSILFQLFSTHFPSLNFSLAYCVVFQRILFNCVLFLSYIHPHISIEIIWPNKSIFAFAFLFLFVPDFHATDFDLSRPISQLAESSERTHFVCIPSYNFSRPVSPFLLSISSDFYKAYLERHDSQYTVSLNQHCQTEHTSQQFCLPAIFTSLDVDFLLDFLERTPQAVFAPRLFLSVIRLIISFFPTHVFLIWYKCISLAICAFDPPLQKIYSRFYETPVTPFWLNLLPPPISLDHVLFFLVMYSYFHTPN